MSTKLLEEESISTLEKPNTGPSKILPFLYLGCQNDVLCIETMRDNHITHVINVSTTGQGPSFISEDDAEHFLRIPVNDCFNAKLQPFFEKTYIFIENARHAGGRVLIHCLAGISRSPTLAIAYIMRYLNLSLDAAYEYVKQRREEISPNFNFLGQLLKYECQQSSESTNHVLVKCSSFEPSLNVRFRPVQVEGSFNKANSIQKPIKSLSRPTSFNFEPNNKLRPRSLLMPTISEPTCQQHTAKLQHADQSQNRSSDTSKLDLINSDYDKIIARRRMIAAATNIKTSSFAEKTDLINSYLRDPSITSNTVQNCSSVQSGDSNNDTTTQTVITSNQRVLVL